MVSVAGPMPMHVTYTFDEHPQGTLARIRVRGDAGSLYRTGQPTTPNGVTSMRPSQGEICAAGSRVSVWESPGTRMSTP
ncbi:hypothetical protein SAMN06272765_8680 [Streptomyces sp. Ag109_G2-15]|nr:hypothetical protein SAMN06272765_8680 [Streptomyces sp. Ag109_G2-15]